MERYARLRPLGETPGGEYVLRRGIPVAVADEAGVRYDPDLCARPAVVVPLLDRAGEIRALHGRYLHVRKNERKMQTFGRSGGTIGVRGGWEAEPRILVEGLFDALSLAVCGWGSVATIGRFAPWLAEAWRGEVVWLASDRGRAGEADAADLAQRLATAETRRLPPPMRSKDWNTALRKLGAPAVAGWIRDRLADGGTKDA